LGAISTPLATIINSSIVTSIVPDDIKVAKVIPIFKSCDKSQMCNYRPISILPYFSKFFEKNMRNRVIDCLQSRHLLIMNQYGFRSDHSTFMALLDMQTKISEATIQSHNKFSIGAFLDLSKAFDTVNHDILLKKLEHYGIRGNCLKWFTDYLSNRKQCVSCNGHSSHFLNIKCGVPQGSILGPLLFLIHIYINDISNATSLLHFIIFVDDTNVFLSA
jgi:hypothetical protein